MERKKERNYNIDLLKLISMFGIVFIHSVSFGGLRTVTEGHPFQEITSSVMYTFFYAMTNVFVIITAWFLPKVTISWKKVCNIAIISSAYSTLVYGILCSVGLVNFGIFELLRSLLALISNQYWFITAYVILYILSPFMNEFLDNLERNRLRLLCLILLSISTIIPTTLFFFQGSSLADASNGQGFFWFLVIYCCVFYLKKHCLDKILHVKTAYLYSTIIVSILFLVVSRYLLYAISIKMGNGGAGSLRFYFNSSLPVALISICTFIIAIRLPSIKYGTKIISAMAPTTLGIYLIHSQPDLSSVMWHDVNRILANNPSTALVLDLALVLAIFFGAMAIDYIRTKIID